MPDIVIFLKKYSVPLLLGLLVLVVLIPNSPHFLPVSGADAAVFVYIGDHILDGDIPYLDHFGNKGPLTYYINALGLLIRRGSLWGVWAIQIPFLFASALLGLHVMSKAFGRLPALFGSLAWILHLSRILREGNFTEEYALLFQFGALVFFWYSEEYRTQMRYLVLVGVSFALGFLLRPNNIGISVSILLFLGISFLVKRDERADLSRRIMYILLGFTVVLLTVAGYFLSVGALGELIEAVFLFNLSLNVTEGSIVEAIFFGIDRLTTIFFVAFVAWVLALAKTFSNTAKSRKQASIYALMSIAFPVEIFLATFGGKGLNHYFISWMPILGLLSAFFAHNLLAAITGQVLLRGKKVKLASLWLFAFLAMISLQPANRLITKTTSFLDSILRNGRVTRAEYSQQDAETVELITRLTEEDEYLLIWGFELKYYFMANRESPSRFAYQYPFSAPGFATQEMIDELILDISTKKPLIIESSRSDNSTVPWIGSPQWETVPGMERVMEFILAHYTVSTLVGPQKWPVYQYVEVE